MIKKTKHKHHLLHVTTLLFTAIIVLSYVRLVTGAEPTVGAVNNWFSLNNATRLSVDLTPNRGENGYHFYSLAPFFQDNNFGMYSGIQTNGNLGNGIDVGNIFIFSVWEATAAYPQAGVTATPFGGEGAGYSLRKQYDWAVGKTYTITLQREGFDNAQNGYRWSASIKDKQTGGVTSLGEILAPPGANLLSTGSAFHERYVGSAPQCSANSSNLEAAGVTFTNLSSDKSVAFYGTPAPNNIFSSSACSKYIHYQNTSQYATTGFGVTATDFATFTPGYSTPTSGSGGAASPSSPSTGTRKPTASGNAPSSPEAVAVTDDTELPASDIPSDPINTLTSNTENLANDSTKEKPSVTFKIIGAIAIPVLAGTVYFLLKKHIFRI